jgi:hypothetical protein
MTWQFATGSFRYSLDEKADDEGRRRYHAERGRPSGEDNESLPAGLKQVSVWLFMTRRNPWLFSVMPVMDADDQAPNIYSETDISHVSLWSDQGDTRSVNARGNLGLRAMTNPDTLSSWFPLPYRPEFTVSGAHVLAVSESGESSNESLAFVRLGAERYDFAYSSELDVITSVDAVMDGEVFAQWRVEICQVL